MAQALRRADFRYVLQEGLGITTLGQSSAPLRAREASTHPAPTSSVPNPAPANANAAPAPPPAAGHGAADQARQPGNQVQNAGQVRGLIAARQAPDEMRDFLAPVVRNLWLLVRLAIFAYFFFSSGRGYGRLSLLMAIGGLAYAINAGYFGQRADALIASLRRHFEDLVDEARGNTPLPASQAVPPVQNANDNGEGSSRSAAMPTPEEVARRLAMQRAEQQRGRVRNTIRQFERTAVLCVVSLWPGIGEGVVQRQEQRRREAERAAEARRLAAEEAGKLFDEAEAKVKARLAETATPAEGKSEASKTTVASDTLPELVGGVEGSSGAEVNASAQVTQTSKGKEKAMD